MTRLITVANSAGGVGKTTTALALAVAFAEYGNRTLLIDLDVRSTATYLLGVENPRISVIDVLRGSAPLSSAITATSERFYLLPSDSRLSHLDEKESDLAEMAMRLRRELELQDSPFDFVIIDSPSTLSKTLLLALNMADFAIAPTTLAMTGVRGVLQVLELSKGAVWLGALPVLTQGSSNDLLELLADEVEILSPHIPKSNSVSEAAFTKKSVLNYAKSGSVALAYRELAYFLLERINSKS
ncbi:MAG: ParA family protein [Actinomycetes bacterium]